MKAPRLTGHPAFSQGLPTDQRTRQREKGLVDVGSFIVPDAQDDGTDSARRTSVRQPIATVPSRCRVPCDASLALAECHEFVTRVGFPPHRSRGRQPRNLADAVAVHIHPGVAEPHRPAPMLPASHCGWHRSAGRRAARLARHKSDDACSLAWRDPWDLDRSAYRRTPRGPSSCQQSLWTNRCRLRGRANSEARSASDPRLLPLASRAGVASRSCRNHSPVLEATSAMVFRFAARRGCRSGRRDQTHAAVHRSAAMVEAAEAAR